MKEILIFAGTTEGRELSARLRADGLAVTACVATEYGAQLMECGEGVRVRAGRLNRAGMEDLMREGSFLCCVDATHPFAERVSEEIRAACEALSLPYCRVSRDTSASFDEALSAGADSGFRLLYADDAAGAAALLKKTEGNILLTTGSRDLQTYTDALGEKGRERLYVRVLPSAESLGKCAYCGVPESHVAAMQGPFDEEMNRALIRHTGAAVLVTKETGDAGGYREKLLAAAGCGIPVIVIRNPERRSAPVGESLREVRDAVLSLAGLREKKRLTITLLGAGPGGRGSLTADAAEALAGADAVFGAESVLGRLKKAGALPPGAEAVPFYLPEKIREWIEGHPGTEDAVIAFSGDTGFYSGASPVLRYFRENEDSFPAEIRVLPGISTVSVFASKLGVPWQDMKLLSSHGRKLNLTGEVRRNRLCMVLLSGLQDVKSTGELLLHAEQAGVIGKTRVTLGFALTTEEEEIRQGTPELLLEAEKEGLYVLLIQNDEAERTALGPGIPDSCFLRDRVPMTKEEIRVLSLSRLRLTGKAVLWDIGAGTGSVSVEAALFCPEARVYAVERNADAAALLRRNLDRFALENVTPVEAEAPEGLDLLPAPTHLFIGGSGGKLKDILAAAMEKNPEVRVVINCITLETLQEAFATARALGAEPECVQVSATRLEPAGRYHMFRAGNPVFILSFSGK